MNPNDKIQSYFFLVIFLAIIALVALIFLPFFIPLAIAATFAVIFWPFYERICRFAGKHENIAALLTVIAATLIILVPLIFIGKIVFGQAQSLLSRIGNDSSYLTARLSTLTEKQIFSFIPDFSLNINQYLRYGIDWLVQNFGQIFAKVSQSFLGLLLTLMAFFYFLKDGQKLIKSLVLLSPLPDSYDHEILNKLAATINSVIRGSLVIAVIQGILTSVGLLLFGVPSPALWGCLAAVSSLIPGVGTSLVIIPSIAYLFITGAAAQGIGLIVWGVIAVGLIDNFLGPKLIGSKILIHPFLILLSVLGGLMFFGPIGFLLGPLSLSMLFALTEIYRLLAQPAALKND